MVLVAGVDGAYDDLVKAVVRLIARPERNPF